MNEIWTSRVGYLTTDRERVVLDITIKSGYGLGKILAPTWPMVIKSKEGKITWDEYTELYKKLMRKRYRATPELFDILCEIPNLVLLCYCKDTHKTCKHCHRYIAVDIILAICKSKGIEANYMGEIGKGGEVK